MIEDYELQQGRLNVRVQQAFGLADIISEEVDGENRLIIVTNDLLQFQFQQQLVEEDYEPIKGRVFVYEIIKNQITEH